jgi:hypothetical protein
MSALAKLKLVNSKRSRTVSPIVLRRNKLVIKIDEQIGLITAQKDGQLYAPKRLKTVTNPDTGERRTIETTKRVKEWFWTTDSGAINFSVRYGSKVIELAKGKNTIEVTTKDELIQTLLVVKEAVLAGELDSAISAASDNLRSGFSK